MSRAHTHVTVRGSLEMGLWSMHMCAHIRLLVQTLTEAQLMEVLTKPRNALSKQYERMFGMSGAHMHITESARRAIAQAARERGTGARGLRSIMENLLQPVMYDVSVHCHLDSCCSWP